MPFLDLPENLQVTRLARVLETFRPSIRLGIGFRIQGLNPATITNSHSGELEWVPIGIMGPVI